MYIKLSELLKHININKMNINCKQQQQKKNDQNKKYKYTK